MTSEQSRATEIAAGVRKCVWPGVYLDRLPVLKGLCRQRSILDVGCVEHDAANADRDGWLHGELCTVARECVGVDSAEAGILKLREKGYNVRCADATGFCLGRLFDAVVAGEVLEHLLNARGFLESARRHIRVGGRLILTVPNANSLNYFLQNLVYGYEVDGYDHVAFYTPLTLTNLLRKCGFELVSLCYVQPKLRVSHCTRWNRFVAKLSRVLQLPFVWLMPRLASELLVVARVADEEKPA